MCGCKVMEAESWPFQIKTMPSPFPPTACTRLWTRKFSRYHVTQNTRSDWLRFNSLHAKSSLSRSRSRSRVFGQSDCEPLTRIILSTLSKVINVENSACVHSFRLNFFLKIHLTVPIYKMRCCKTNAHHFLTGFWPILSGNFTVFEGFFYFETN